MARKRDSKGRFVSKRRSRSRRKTPPRDSKGRFVSRGRRSRSRSRRSYRRNPVTGDLLGMFTGGVTEAGQVLIGKAAARSIPDLANLPKQGNVGLAIQAAVALGVGWLADRFVSEDAARAILAGGLTAPMETLVVAYNVPFLASALSPTTAQAEVGAYVRRSGGRMGAYVPRRGVSSYVPPSRPEPEASGMGMYYS